MLAAYAPLGTENGQTMRFQPIPFRNSPARFARLALLVLAVGLSGTTLHAAEPSSKATSSKAAREDALKTIPFDKLSERAKTKINNVTSHTTLYRRLPIEVADCDPKLHYFLICNPDVVVNIWDVLDITNVNLQRTGDTTYKAADGSGTAGNVEYLYSDADTQVIFAEGTYDGSLFPKKIRGECVLVLKSSYSRETNGRYYVTDRMDLFVRLDNVGVEMIARTFSPLINKCADGNFSDTIAFMHSLSKTAEANPAGIERLSAKLNKVDEVTRSDFTQIALGVPDRIDAPAPPPRTTRAKPVVPASNAGLQK